MIGLGIALAALGALCFAVGVSLQHNGVARLRTGDTVPSSSLVALLTTPIWWYGVLSSTIGAIAHAIALSIAPLTIVQPVGVLALGLTAMINARVSGERLTRPAVLAIGASTVGVVAFLVLASENVVASTVPDGAELTAAVPVALAVGVLALVGAGSHGRVRALTMSTAAGVSYGFTALLMRAVAQDFAAGQVGASVYAAMLAIALSMAMGGWFMQQSYAAARPQLAVASVTVVDPIVAVVLGAALLGEAAGISFLVGAAAVLTGAVAIAGVVSLCPSELRTRCPTSRTEVRHLRSDPSMSTERARYRCAAGWRPGAHADHGTRGSADVVDVTLSRICPPGSKGRWSSSTSTPRARSSASRWRSTAVRSA